MLEIYTIVTKTHENVDLLLGVQYFVELEDR